MRRTSNSTDKITIKARDIRDFGTCDERLTRGTWEIALIGGNHRDADAVDESNARVILRELAKVDPEQNAHDTLGCSHWAVGWYDHLIVDVTNAAVMQVLRECADAIASYPLLDEHDHSALECERHDDGQCDEHCSLCECDRERHRNGECEDGCEDCCYEHRTGKCAASEYECRHCAEEASEDAS